MLKGEFHDVRSTIEQYSNMGKIEHPDCDGCFVGEIAVILISMRCVSPSLMGRLRRGELRILSNLVEVGKSVVWWCCASMAMEWIVYCIFIGRLAFTRCVKMRASFRLIAFLMGRVH